MIAVNISTTARQDARLAEFLDQTNAERAAHGDPTFADMNELAAFLLRDQLVSSVQTFETAEAERVKAAYAAASNTVQAQVRSLLGVS